MELTCRVAQGYRVVWDAFLPSTRIVRSENLRQIAQARYEGVTMEKSSAMNPQPSLRVNGTFDGVQRIMTSAGCIARSIKYGYKDDCFGELVSIEFYGKVRSIYRQQTADIGHMPLASYQPAKQGEGMQLRICL